MKKFKYNLHQVFFNLFYILLICDLLLYQSKYMLNNMVFLSLNFIILFSYFIVINKIKINKIVIIMSVFIILFSLMSFNLNDIYDLKRGFVVIFTYIIYFMIFVFSINIYNKVNLTKYKYFYVFSLSLLICVTVLFNLDDRVLLANPNWIALLILYTYMSISLLSNKNPKLYMHSIILSILFIFIYFSLESRGVSLMIILSLLLIVLLTITPKKLSKYMFIVYFLMAIIGFLVFLDYYFTDPLLKVLISQFSERGMSGREKVFEMAHNYLFYDHETNGFLGNGAGFSVSYIDEVKGNSIRLYFSFYEIVLKFSIMFFLLFTLFLNKIWLSIYNITHKKQRIILMSFFIPLTLTVFFYGGYAPGLYGINIYNFFLLGLIYAKSKDIILLKKRDRGIEYE